MRSKSIEVTEMTKSAISFVSLPTISVSCIDKSVRPRNVINVIFSFYEIELGFKDTIFHSWVPVKTSGRSFNLLTHQYISISLRSILQRLM